MGEEAIVLAEEAVEEVLKAVDPVEPVPTVAVAVPAEEAIPSDAPMDVITEADEVENIVDVPVVEPVVEIKKPSLVDSVISDVLKVDVDSPTKEVISLEEMPAPEQAAEPEQVATVA